MRCTAVAECVVKDCKFACVFRAAFLPPYFYNSNNNNSGTTTENNEVYNNVNVNLRT